VIGARIDDLMPRAPFNKGDVSLDDQGHGRS